MSICDVPVIAEVCGFVGDGVAGIISAPFDFLASAVGSAAGWLFQTAWTVMDQTTLVDLTNPAYLEVYNLLFGVAVVLVVIFFLAQLITGMIRRDPGALLRAVTGSAKSILGGFLVITLATLLLEVTDQLAIGIVQAAGLTMSEMGLRLGALFAGLGAISIAAPGVGIIITLFLGCMTIAGTAIIWFSLLIRKALILAAIVLAPVALSGAAWDTTRAWFGRWASFVLALIVSKLVVVLVLLVAVVQMDAPIDLDLQSIADPAAGLVLLLVAAFAPYLVYKLISFAGIDMYQAISAEQEAKDAVNRPLPVPTAPRTPAPREQATPQLPSATPADGGGVAASSGASGSVAPAVGGGGAAGVGASAGAGAGGGAAAGAGAAAAGPAAAAVIAAQVLSEAAQAGPRVGQAVGGTADAHTTESAAPPPPPSPPPAAPTGSAPPPASPRAPEAGSE